MCVVINSWILIVLLKSNTTVTHCKWKNIYIKNGGGPEYIQTMVFPIIFRSRTSLNVTCPPTKLTETPAKTDQSVHLFSIITDIHLFITHSANWKRHAATNILTVIVDASLDCDRCCENWCFSSIKTRRSDKCWEWLYYCCNTVVGNTCF